MALAPPRRLQRELEGGIVEIRVEPARQAARLIRDLPGVRRAAAYGESVHVAVEGGMDAWPELRSALESRGLSVHGAQSVEPSLEDVFLARTEPHDSEAPASAISDD